MTEVDHEGVSAVVRHKNRERYLVLKRSNENKLHPGIWEFPGGKLEENETPGEAVIREIREEIGLEAKIKEEGEVFIWRSQGETFRNHPFLVEVESDDLETSWEHSEYRWVNREELESFDFIRNVKGLESLEKV